MFKLAL
jgi:dynein light intermediate chain